MTTEINTAPDCPYCQAKARHDVVDFFCATCGAEFSMEIVCRMKGLNPLKRAERIGWHHGHGRWGYLWCMPEMDRETLRAYANGFLIAAPNDYLDGAQARRDAFGPLEAGERDEPWTLPWLFSLFFPRRTSI
jgi:hypothetical protein